MYLLHNSVCFACIHQLVLTFISIDAQARFICHARSFQLWWIGDSGGFRIANKLVKTVFVFSLCIFFSFLSFVRKKYSNFGVATSASCIRMLSLNASMPRSTPSLFAGYHICMTKAKGWVKRHYIIQVLTGRPVWDNLESRKFKVIIILNIATVDAPGAIIISASKSTLTVWPDLNNPIFMLSFIKRSLRLGLVLNLNTLPDENLYFRSSWESSFMACPIVWLVGILASGDSRRWHSLLLTSSTQSPPQRNTSDMADITSSHW